MNSRMILIVVSICFGLAVAILLCIAYYLYHKISKQGEIVDDLNKRWTTIETFLTKSRPDNELSELMAMSSDAVSDRACKSCEISDSLKELKVTAS